MIRRSKSEVDVPILDLTFRDFEMDLDLLIVNIVTFCSSAFGVGSQARTIISQMGASMTVCSVTRTSPDQTSNSSPGGQDVTPGSLAQSRDPRSSSMTWSTATGMGTSEYLAT